MSPIYCFKCRNCGFKFVSPYPKEDCHIVPDGYYGEPTQCGPVTRDYREESVGLSMETLRTAH